MGPTPLMGWHGSEISIPDRAGASSAPAAWVAARGISLWRAGRAHRSGSVGRGGFGFLLPSRAAGSPPAFRSAPGRALPRTTLRLNGLLDVVQTVVIRL